MITAAYALIGGVSVTARALSVETMGMVLVLVMVLFLEMVLFLVMELFVGMVLSAVMAFV